MQFSRSFVLTIALVTAVPATFQAKDCDSASKVASGFFTSKMTAGKAAAVVLFAVLYIRLVTKSTAKQRVDRTWTDYFLKLASLLNVTQIGTGDYWNTFDQIIIGDQFKLIDKATREKDENGLTVTYKDKAVKAYPSGLMGYFDAYIMQNLKKLFEHFDSLKKCDGFLGSVSWE